MIAGPETARPADEGLLHRAWAQRAFEAPRLQTVNGARVQVVFPGRANGAEGPDFLDGSIHVEGLGLMRGDVEVHVRARDWMTHGHHRDPGYNGVVLHVVWDADSLWTERQDGEHVATVSLKGCLAIPSDETAKEDCSPQVGDCSERARTLGCDEVGRILDEAGNARLVAKSAQFEGEMAVHPPVEVLYRGLMRALGYSRNREPFLELAGLLPWSTIEGLTSSLSKGGRPGAITSWLLGVAGLIKNASPSGRKLWHRSPLRTEMDSSSWRLSGVRPANHPVRRMEGAGRLLARFAGEGLLEGFERAMLLAEQHRDPGLIIELAAAPPAIGWERAREMTVNVVLPFFHAFGDRNETLRRAALQLFAQAPAGPGNRKVKDMAAQLGISDVFSVAVSARREQGLIHLIEGPCRHGWCAGCPIGRAVPNNSSALAAAS